MTGMKHQNFKEHLPASAEEWLEYQEHRERWSSKAQEIADKHLKKKFPISGEDREITKKIRDHLLTSHWKKP